MVLCLTHNGLRHIVTERFARLMAERHPRNIYLFIEPGKGQGLPKTEET